MDDLWNIITLIFLFYSITALQVEDNSDDDTKNLLQYGREASRLSKVVNNNSVSTWFKTTFANLDKIFMDGDIQDSNHLGRHGVTDEAKLWPNGIVPYVILGPYNAEEEYIVKLAMDTIQLWTCVKFVPYSGEHDYIEIEHFDDFGCGSIVGREGGQQLVALEAPNCFNDIGKVMHELLHVLGIIHEHARPDRDKYININKDNMEPDDYHNFDVYTKLNVDDYGIPYDFNSVMHYAATASSSNGQKTIEAKVGNPPVGQRKGLSVRDALKIMKMYNCYYKIDKEKHSSRVLPNANETRGVKVEEWNTFFRDFNYTHP